MNRKPALLLCAGGGLFVFEDSFPFDLSTKTSQHTVTQNDKTTNHAENALCDADRERYQTLKQKLHASKKQQAKYLHEIKADNLYRVEYDNFGEFCDQEVGFSRRQADRLANWGRVLEILGPDGPNTESQARPLASVRRRAGIQSIWDRATSIAEREGSRLTQKLVRKATSLYLAVEQSRKKMLEERSIDCKMPANWSVSDASQRQKVAPARLMPPPSSEANSEDEGSGGSVPEHSRPQQEPPSTDQVKHSTSTRTHNANSRVRESAEPSPKNEEDGSQKQSSLMDEEETAFIQIGTSDPETGREEVDETDRKGTLPWRPVGESQLEALIRKADAPKRTLPKSTTEEGIADSIWQPISPSLSSFEASLPMGNAEKAIFQPEELGRLKSPVTSSRNDQVLVCPGIDLFGPIVPELMTEKVVHDIEGAEVDPILFTRYLDRASDYSIPEETWLGTYSTRRTLGERAERLKEFGNLAVRWVLYDLQAEDWTEGFPPLPAPIDWVVYDPPKNRTIEIKELQGLIETAEESGARWAFRSAFKAHGRQLPT